MTCTSIDKKNFYALLLRINSFSMSAHLELINTSVGIISLVLAIWFYYCNISKKLDILLTKHQSRLAYDQAADLLELYLAATQRELQITARNFFRHRVSKLKTVEEATSLVFTDFDKVIRENRVLLSKFLLNGDITFQEFLENTNPRESGIIRAAQEAVHLLFRDMMQKTISAEETRHKVLHLMEEAYHNSNLLLKDRLRQMYPTRNR